MLKTRYPEVPILALTATATHKVQVDIRTQLGMRSEVLFKSSSNRPNLRYEVRKKSKSCVKEIADIARRHKQGSHYSSGIVYCFSKKDCEKVADELNSELGGSARRPVATFYHAGLEKSQRERRQQQWSSDEIPIVCATGLESKSANQMWVGHAEHEL